MQANSKVLKALTVLVKNVPLQMTGWLPQILPPVWGTLTTSAEKHVSTFSNVRATMARPHLFNMV